ncbi:hypothetical protein MMC34_002543 [Xylographa carneopallida]|nr:hypothetical protein [Xylographa carneopallida]
MKSLILATLSLLAPLCLGQETISVSTSTPATVAAMPTSTPGSLANDVLALFSNIASNPNAASLGSDFISSIQTDAVNYALAHPSALLGEIPGLFSVLNAVVATEIYFPALTSFEGAIGGALTTIVAADATNPAALASNVGVLVQAVATDTAVASLFHAIGESILTAGEAFALANPSAVLADVSLAVSDVNPLIATETYAPAFSTLEAVVQGELASIVSYDAPAGTGVPSAGVSSFVTQGLNGTRTGAPSPTISTFQGAAGRMTVGAWAVVGAAGLVGLALR